MSQKNFTSHGHPIPGAPYRPDQQPRNVARCGGPGLCPDCSREATIALTAAAPHLRAAWGQEMAEKIRAKFLGPDSGRNPMNGQGSRDAALDAAYDEGLQTALALLEGVEHDDEV